MKNLENKFNITIKILTYHGQKTAERLNKIRIFFDEKPNEGLHTHKHT